MNVTPRAVRQSRQAIITGFLLVLALMLSVLVVGYSRVADMRTQIDDIVTRHHLETDVLYAMHNLVRERTLSLYTMYFLRDPIAVDEEYVRFSMMVDEFVALREQFSRMDLEPPESAMFEEALAIIRTTQPLQASIAARLRDGQRASVAIAEVANDLRLEQNILAVFSRLIHYESTQTALAVERAERAYRIAELAILALGGAALALGALIGFVVTRRTRRIESALANEKERAEVTLHSIGDAVITTRADNTITYLNPVAEQLTGWRLIEATGQPLAVVYRLVNEITRAPVAHPAYEGPLDGRVVGVDRHALLLARGGETYAVEDTVAPIRDEEGEVLGVVLVFRDVTRARRLADQLSWQATHDALTDLINRHEFERRLATLLDSARLEQRHHALLYLDLDQFKVVNDTCGHVAGDELLKQLARSLRPVVRVGDTLARLGGDEFGVLLADCPPQQAEHIAENLREHIQNFRFSWDDKSFRIGVSIGLVVIHETVGTAADVLSAADAACYLAKDHGRNRVWVHESSDAEVARRHGEMQWIARLTRAFEENRFLLHAQHIVPLVPGSADTGLCELLVRMRDESGEVIPPLAFLPAAERYGMMGRVDRWVVAHAFRWLAAQQRSTPLLNINLSSQSLGDDHFLEFVLEQQASTGIALSRICFEITETAAISHWDRTTEFIRTLRDRGGRFALDDFGSGMASFAYLKQLPVDYLKIDGMFVRNMLEDPMDHAIIETTTRLAHVAGMLTIAEFVENQAVMQRLRMLGVDFAQGYAIARPVPLDVVLDTEPVRQAPA